MIDEHRVEEVEMRKQKQRIRFLIYGIVGMGLVFLMLHWTIRNYSAHHEWDTQKNLEDEENSNQNVGSQSTETLDKRLKRLIEKDPSLKVIEEERDQYPDQLIYLLVHNQEAKQFVLDYPHVKDQETSLDIKAELKGGKVPFFMQWDGRWGYRNYGNEMMAIDGCGPTCLSMVATFLSKNEKMNPYWMAQYSFENGYYMDGATAWKLMDEGAQKLGLGVKQLPLEEQRIIDNLVVGNPVICIMGPGKFTSAGHFIVLAGYKDGKFIVHDPNSRVRSKKMWAYEEFSDQIRNLWVYWAE